ncbi:hypothetical protein DEO72_LG5g1548 [Vigna unguiculata]|uniref:Uncharacterized protein n=1 Tax=Vigna unguiculata TaxID=3917 RepID=A0A4D6LYA5_VIGUN|nr:hypothetical protein DEO72_LG5g1548 [Vigna unguiculata]
MKELRERKEQELQEREEKEQRAKEEEEQREKHEKESLLTPLACMVEMKSLKGDDNVEDLYIKEQWHKQWGEERMIEKATTTWRTSIWGFSEREEITPLGGGSKISEEDRPL